MATSRILITGDLLRPHPADATLSESIVRIQWLEDLLRPPLRRVTDLPVHRLACEGPLSFPALYRDCGLEPSFDVWAELYAGDLPPILEERLVEACRDALVISLEMPPSVARALTRAGVPVLDSVVDPLRFLIDIPLAWRSPCDAMREALAPFAVTPYEIERRVAQIRAKMRWMPAPSVPEGATLVLDQLPTDAAMIDPSRGRRVTWDDYVDELAALEARGPVIWRPHPYNSDTSALTMLLGRETMRSENFYSLLAQDPLVRVAAISSGGVVEARAFGKEGIHFMDRSAGVELPGWARPVPVVGHWLSPHFFGAVLSGVIPTRRDVEVLPVERDVFRRANNTDWDFGWIDQVVERRSAHERRHEALVAEARRLEQDGVEVRHRLGDLEARMAEADHRTAHLETRTTGVEQRAASAEVRVSEALAQSADRARLAAHAATTDAQLRRLQDADRPRLRALGNDIARQARAGGWRVGVLGAGAHTEWLLRETALRGVPSLVVFDRHPKSAQVEGFQVHPASGIPAMRLDAVIVSSLAFQDEMVAYLKSLGLRQTRIFMCYPPDDPGRVAA